MSALSFFYFFLSPFLFLCLCLPSCLPSLCPHISLLSPFVSCLFVITVSVLSPFCFLLSPLLFLVGHYFRLVFLLYFACHVPPLSPSRLQPFTFVSQLLLHTILCTCLRALGCVSLAILYICLPVSTFVSQLWAAVSASAFIFVSQLSMSASALQSLILYLSPNPDCCVRPFTYSSPSCGRLCLAILCLPALDVASSNYGFEKPKLFGVYGLRWWNLFFPGKIGSANAETN